MKFKLRYFLEKDFDTYQKIVSNSEIARLSGMKILTNSFENWMSFKGIVGRQGFLAIVDESDQVVGGIFIFEKEVKNNFELGYFLKEGLWNQGIMTRSVYYAIKNLAYRVQGDLKVVASVLVDNLASSRVLEKNGFNKKSALTERISGYDGKIRHESQYELVLKKLD